MTDLQTIRLNRLVHAKANVRRTGRGASLEGLMTSIAVHGLRQNLNVRPISGNRFEVVAGGRRLEAMRRLAKAGKLDATVPVSCLLLTEGENATELSLVENAHRADMHPDDECAAFAELADGGMELEDIGARFGVTEVVVRRRLRLARVSPPLRKLFREAACRPRHVLGLVPCRRGRQTHGLAGAAGWHGGGCGTGARCGGTAGLGAGAGHAQALEAEGGGVLWTAIKAVDGPPPHRSWRCQWGT